jgi:predicted tellurium resistance membrane protein TerC
MAIQLATGLIKPFFGEHETNYRPALHLISTAVKIGGAVASYFIFAAVMQRFHEPLWIIGVGILTWCGLHIFSEESSHTGVGVWLLIKGVQRIAHAALWKATGLGLLQIGAALFLQFTIPSEQDYQYHNCHALIDRFLGIDSEGNARASR